MTHGKQAQLEILLHINNTLFMEHLGSPLQEQHGHFECCESNIDNGFGTQYNIVVYVRAECSQRHTS